MKGVFRLAHLTHQEEDGDGGGLLLEVAAAGAPLLPHHGDQHDGETHQTYKEREANLRLNPSSLLLHGQLFLFREADIILEVA